MSPFQKLRGHDHQPHLTYPFGAVVFAQVSKSSREEVDSKYARGVYLGPVLGSTGQLVHIRLDSGETKKVIAPGLSFFILCGTMRLCLKALPYPMGFSRHLMATAFASCTFPTCREGVLLRIG